MNYLAGEQFWMITIVLIICLIGLVVFLLRKHIPGLAEYEEEDEEKIAEDNVSRILMTLEEEEMLKTGADSEEDNVEDEE